MHALRLLLPAGPARGGTPARGLRIAAGDPGKGRRPGAGSGSEPAPARGLRPGEEGRPVARLDRLPDLAAFPGELPRRPPPGRRLRPTEPLGRAGLAALRGAAGGGARPPRLRRGPQPAGSGAVRLGGELRRPRAGGPRRSLRPVLPRRPPPARLRRWRPVRRLHHAADAVTHTRARSASEGNRLRSARTTRARSASEGAKRR